MSSLVSAFLIWVAFKFEYFTIMWDWIVHRTSNTFKTWTKPTRKSGVKRHPRVPNSVGLVATESSDLEAGVVVTSTASDNAGDEPRTASAKGES